MRNMTTDENEVKIKNIRTILQGKQMSDNLVYQQMVYLKIV